MYSDARRQGITRLRTPAASLGASFFFSHHPALYFLSCSLARIGCGPRTGLLSSFTDLPLARIGCGPRTGSLAPTITWITDEANLSIRIGYKNIPVNFGGAPKVPDSGK